MLFRVPSVEVWEKCSMISYCAWRSGNREGKKTVLSIRISINAKYSWSSDTL
jgi:hypothetical protein